MEALFLTVLEISLSMSVMILLMIVCSRIFTKLFMARFKCWVWLLISLRLLIPYNIQFSKPILQFEPPAVSMEINNQTGIQLIDESSEQEVQNSPIPTVSFAEEPSASQIEEPSASIHQPAQTIPLLTLAAYIWLTGSLFYLVYQLFLYGMFIRRVHRWSTVADSALTAYVQRQAIKLGIHRSIRVLVSNKQHSPMMSGFIHPSLILPKAAYSEEQLTFIIQHELIHYRNKDIWIKLLALIATATHWFNPFVHLMNFFLGQDLELSCDAAVVAKQPLAIRKAYNETILNTLHQVEHTVPMTTAFLQKKNLRQRFLNILDMSVKRRGRLALCFVLITALLCGSLVACSKTTVDLNEPTQDEVNEEKDKPIDTQPTPEEEEIVLTTIGYDEFVSLMETFDYNLETNLIMTRLDEGLRCENHFSSMLYDLAALNLAPVPQNVIASFDYPFTMQAIIGDQTILFEFKVTGEVLVNGEVMYIGSADAANALKANNT